MNKPQLIYYAIREFHKNTKCEKSKIVVTINLHTILEVFKENGNSDLDEFLSTMMSGGELKIFGVELKLSKDYEDNVFTIGFKNYL